MLLNALVQRLSQDKHKIQDFKSGDKLLAEVEQDISDVALIDIKMSERFQVLSAMGEYGVTDELEHVSKVMADGQYIRPSFADRIALLSRLTPGCQIVSFRSWVCRP